MAISAVISAVQMVSTDRISENLSSARLLIAQAVQQQAQLILLPENFSGMFALDQQKIGAAEEIGSGPVQQFLSDMASSHQRWIAGGLYLKQKDKLTNSLLVFDPSGALVCRYDKLHLFRFFDESVTYDEARLFEAGSQLVCFDAPFGRVGLSICYDVRFPELYRAMNCPDLILVPAAFTETTGKAHWEILLRARAIENHCYLLAANQGGKHPSGHNTYGYSMMIDPWGNVINSASQGEAVVSGEVNHSTMNQFRQMLPNHNSLFSCQMARATRTL